MSPKKDNFDALDSETVALLLGVTDRMLRIYCKDKGLPFRGDGRGRTFRWSEVRDWFIAYKIDQAGNSGNGGNGTLPKPTAPPPEGGDPVSGQEVPQETFKEALTRKTRADADLKELELAIKRGQVVAIDDVRRTLDGVFTNVKTKILAIPSKLGGRLDGIRDRNQRKAILEAECRQVCQELSAIDVTKPKGATSDAAAAN